MTATIRRWRAVFSIYFQDGIAYRASGLIWITTDLVTAVTMPLVWARASMVGGNIAGFTSSDFVLYYLCVLLIGSIVTSHIMWDLAMEIKEGQFTTVLLRPMGLFELMFLRNLAWRIIRFSLFAPFFIALLFIYHSYLVGAHVYLSWQFFAALVMGHLVSFVFVMMMAMLALFTEEVFSIFELYYIPMLLLSGQLFPVGVMPGWIQVLARHMPFYFTTGAPTEILIGRLPTDQIGSILAWQVFWIVFCYAGFRILCARGMKHYTAVGM